MKRAISPITRSQQKADFEHDRPIIKDLVFKIRLLSGVAQNILNSATSTLRTDYGNIIKQELKRDIKILLRQLLQISSKEHSITKSFEVDEYFDDRADDLYAQAKEELFIVYNITHRFFSELETETPSLPSIFASAIISHSLVLDCMRSLIEVSPITERFKPIMTEMILREHELAYKYAKAVAEGCIKRTKFKTPPHDIFANNSFFLGEKHTAQLATAVEQLGLKLFSLETWRTLADNEHAQLGNKASIRKKPIPIKLCSSKTTSTASHKKKSSATK